MDLEKAFKILGVPDGGLRTREDFDKVRQRSKELYKRYAADKTRQGDAKRVCEAFELIKQKYEKRLPPTRKESQSSVDKPNGSGASVPLSTRSHSDLTAPVSSKRAQEPKASASSEHAKKLKAVWISSIVD